MTLSIISFVLRLVLILIPLINPFPPRAERKSAKSSYFVYVGTYTGEKSKGIYVFDFYEGNASSARVAAETANPSFLAVGPAEDFLYAVNEISNYEGQKTGAVSAFSIDRKNGRLAFLNQVSSRGADPCYVTLDVTGKYVLAANYTSGTVAVFPRRRDGTLGGPTAVLQHTGHGPNRERQEGPHAHQVVLSRDDRFAIAVDLGLDKLLVYRFDSASGTLKPNDPPFSTVEPGSGPRHLAFRPDGRFAYVLAEMGSTITAFAFDSATGVLRKLQSVSSLPAGFKGQNGAAEIVVHPSGKFLYASNRGDNSIVVFAVGSDGKLTFLERTPTQGKTPRGFSIDPTGAYLLAANQGSDTIVVFHIGRDGRLKPMGTIVNVPSPVAVQFVRAE
jgi:6-phosphogluconolactonase